MRISTEIKKRVSCQDACREYGVDVNRAGFTRCLWHSEKTASLKIYPGDRGYHCFGCGASGSVIRCRSFRRRQARRRCGR